MSNVKILGGFNLSRSVSSLFYTWHSFTKIYILKLEGSLNLLICLILRPCVQLKLAVHVFRDHHRYHHHCRRLVIVVIFVIVVVLLHILIIIIFIIFIIIIVIIIIVKVIIIAIIIFIIIIIIVIKTNNSIIIIIIVILAALLGSEKTKLSSARADNHINDEAKFHLHMINDSTNK